MIKSLVLKEWLKLRYYIAILLLVSCSVLVNFYFDIRFAFSTIEPESMMWYRYSHIGDKPYYYISYLFLSFGAVVALVQFLPEKIKNRIKIMAHLPLELKESLFIHLAIGTGFVFLLSTLTAWILLLIMSHFYPELIVQITFKDTIIYSFLSVVLYLGLSAAILERKPFISALKLIFSLLCIVVLLKEEYVLLDTFWVVLVFFIPFMVLDSFYSIKEQRLKSVFYKTTGTILLVLLIVQSYTYYKKNYKHEFNRYYIFYSNLIDQFVYQKNFGKHQFEYGIQGVKTFDRKEYESYLPFVYWRNLDIQNKLPITIKDKEFSKNTIKNSRLGFSYDPKMLQSIEAKLYPLLNPQSDKGMISFPEEVFSLEKEEAKVYNFDGDKEEKLIEKELNEKLQKNSFSFPAKGIWGKATNMKPYDLGYLILDSEKKLFNLKRANDKIELKQISYPSEIELAYIKISENKQKQLSGYALDTKSNFYLLSWDFDFIKIDLEKFDHLKMKLKLIANPINYLIRYDDGVNYYADVFKRDEKLALKKVRQIEINSF